MEKMEIPLDPRDIEFDNYFEFLNNLRDSGVTNMFGAAPYLEDEFGLSRNEAIDILGQWMESYR